ncbi:MAG: DNA repair protein RecO [Paludibacteraceae bacterium]|nr:DNA repair protein RecO [Paludibacteraceae bacterium]
MQEKTRGIVMGSLKYSDSSVIVTVYTQKFGRISYMIYGVAKKKSAFRSAFLQPLTLVELDVLHTPGKEIQKIKDVRTTIPLTGISFHPVRNSIALFVAELMLKSLRISEPDNMMYDFLENAIQILDCNEQGLSNFHLIFMIRLARYLGFEPDTLTGTGEYFDMLNATFCVSQPPHIHFMNTESTKAFTELAKCNFDNMHRVSIGRELRYQLINNLEHFYRLHLPDFKGINSLGVLHELFD